MWWMRKGIRGAQIIRGITHPNTDGGKIMPKDKTSDEYCDASVNSSVRGMKQMGVKGQDIIFALNRAILKLQYEEWQKREGR